MSQQDAAAIDRARDRSKDADGEAAELATRELEVLLAAQVDNTSRMSRELERLTGLEARVTILGHVQRGGTPSPVDRVLATRLGTATADLVASGVRGVMVAVRNDRVVPVPLEEVAGKRRMVPLDHPWIETGRDLGLCFGD